MKATKTMSEAVSKDWKDRLSHRSLQDIDSKNCAYCVISCKFSRKSIVEKFRQNLLTLKLSNYKDFRNKP